VWAAGVVVLMALAAAGCGTRQVPPRRAAPRVPAVPHGPVTAAQLVRGATGWLLTSRALLLTTDGGRAWAPITPPGLRAGTGRVVRGRLATPGRPAA